MSDKVDVLFLCCLPSQLNTVAKVHVVAFKKLCVLTSFRTKKCSYKFPVVYGVVNCTDIHVLYTCNVVFFTFLGFKRMSCLFGVLLDWGNVTCKNKSTS